MNKFIMYGLLASVMLSGCNLLPNKGFSDSGDKTSALILSHNSQGQVVQTTAQLSENNIKEVLQSGQSANENAAYFTALGSLYSNTNLDGKDFAIITMAEALAGTKRMPTNSNDVKLAEVNASVAKHQVWASVTKGLGFAAIGGATVVKSVDAIAELGKAAGTIINNTGDGNDIDVTQNEVDQTATDNSTISDSGNLDQAKGVPLNAGDLAPVALGTPTPDDGQPDNIDGCTCPPGLTPRPDDPSFCSDGQGGGQPASCPVELVNEE